MARPKHRRCLTCGVVTARYVRTQNAGAFIVRVWATDPRNGEVATVNGTDIRCTKHAATQPQSRSDVTRGFTNAMTAAMGSDEKW